MTPTSVTKLPLAWRPSAIIIAPALGGGWYVEVPRSEAELSRCCGVLETAIGYALGIKAAFGFKVALRLDDQPSHIVEIVRPRSGAGWQLFLGQADDVIVIGEFRSYDIAAKIADRLVAATGWTLIDWENLERNPVQNRFPTRSELVEA